MVEMKESKSFLASESSGDLNRDGILLAFSES